MAQLATFPRAVLVKNSYKLTSRWAL